MGGGIVSALVMMGMALSAKLIAVVLVGAGVVLLVSLLIATFLDGRWGWRGDNPTRQQQLALLDAEW